MAEYFLDEISPDVGTAADDEYLPKCPSATPVLTGSVNDLLTDLVDQRFDDGREINTFIAVVDLSLDDCVHDRVIFVPGQIRVVVNKVHPNGTYHRPSASFGTAAFVRDV